MTVGVRGLQYYSFQEPQSNEPITLKREPKNPHDPKAVAVYNQHGEKMGYIGRKYKVNEKVFDAMKRRKITGDVVALFGSILVIEIDLP